MPELRLDQRLLLRRAARPPERFLFAAAPVLAAAVAVAAAGPGRAPSHEGVVEAARRIQNACFARRRLGSEVPRGRAHLRMGDFLREDFSRYDLLFYFESGTFVATALFDKIRRELRPGARLLVAHGILPPEGLHETAAYGVVKVYVQPAGGGGAAGQDGAAP